jgi:hypothetical protein
MRKASPFIVAALILLVGGLTYVSVRRHTGENGAVSTTQSATSTGIPEPPPLGPHRDPPAGYKEYYDEAYRLSLFYPESLVVQKTDEGSGASTITFQSPAEERGFQIFVVPYAEPQITTEQFRKDAPSGVRKGLKDVMIDGATGASFYSENTALGETAEIWLIHGWYLYEVTTLKPLAPWLGDIMQSWKFI